MYIYDNHELQACFTMSSITRITSSSFSGKISLSFRISICFDKSIITFISLAFITPKLSKSACV